MEIKIKIRTPQGHAVQIEKKLQPFVLGFLKRPDEIYVNKAEDELIWVVRGSVKQILKISKNVARYDSYVKGIMGHKLLKNMLDEDSKKELDDMLLNQTKIDIIKEASAQEIVEANKTYWQMIKETFTMIAKAAQ
jgi:hypothetical protein